MRAKYMCVVFMCVFGITACGAENEVSYDKLEKKQSVVQQPQEASPSPAPREEVTLSFPMDITKYLALVGQSSCENDWLRIDAVKDFVFVDNENAINIYRDGVHCGWLSMVKFETSEWVENPDDAVNMIYSGSNNVCQFIKSGTYEYGDWYMYQNLINPYPYSDTEWLLAEKIFDTMDEALAECVKTNIVLWSKEKSEYAYQLYVEDLVVKEDLDALISAISFSDNSFSEESGEGNRKCVNAYEYETENQKVLSQEFAGKIRYQVEAKDFTYDIPQGLVAWQEGENEWKLYGYSIGEVSLEEIGVIRTAVLESGQTMQAILGEIGVSEDEAGEVVETEGGWQYSYMSGENLYTEEQIELLEERGVPQEVLQDKKYFKNLVLYSNESGCVMEVKIQVFGIIAD